MHGKSSREGDRKGVSQWRVCVVRPSAIGHQILPGNLLGTSAKHYLLLSQLLPKELGYWYPNLVCLWQRTAPADEGVNSPALRSAKLKYWQKEVGTVHFKTINIREWRWDVNNVTQVIYFFCKLLWVGEDNGAPLHCSCLENPRDGGAWWAAVYGVTQSRTRLKWLSKA